MPRPPTTAAWWTRAILALGAATALAGCGAADDPESGAGPVRQVDIDAFEYAFEADEEITIEAGDTVEFDVRNTGQLDHSMEVLDPESSVLGRTERIPPGAVRSVSVTFDDAGVYRVICDIDDHLSRGQQARFEVVTP